MSKRYSNRSVVELEKDIELQDGRYEWLKERYGSWQRMAEEAKGRRDKMQAELERKKAQ